MNGNTSRRGLRITTILVTMVVGVVAIILVCCILLFLNRYRSAMVQSARTNSAQAVSQVSNTVGSYMRDMYQAMELVEFDMALLKSMRQAPETANYNRQAYNTGELLGSGGFDAKQ